MTLFLQQAPYTLDSSHLNEIPFISEWSALPANVALSVVWEDYDNNMQTTPSVWVCMPNRIVASTRRLIFVETKQCFRNGEQAKVEYMGDRKRVSDTYIWYLHVLIHF